MAFNQEIVITGVGVFSPIGIGTEPFWASLCEGRSGIQPLPMFDDPTLPVPFGGKIENFDPKQYVRPRKSLKVMNRDIQLGFAAADMACVDAGLHKNPPDPDRFGVMLGTDMMPCDLDELVAVYRSCIVNGRFELSRWGQAFGADMFPLWMLKYLPNMPACHVGIAQDARGPNNTITLGDVSTLSAIREAVRVLQRGQADVLIAGGVCSRIHPALWGRHQVMGQSQRHHDPAGASRPFDAQRDGIVNSEGAGAVILETQSRAQERGAKILARVLGCAAAFEPRRKGQPLLGTAIRRAIVAALQAANITPPDVGFVAAHGASTVEDDQIESQAIHETLGDVPVTAPKSYFGHLGAASGSLEMVLCILAFQHGLIPPTLNYEHPDPQCPINVVHGRPLPLNHPTALILSHSPQGQAVAVVLGGADSQLAQKQRGGVE
jgi:3-oxoacyl-[acyl-carrier-protein] synthase II